MNLRLFLLYSLSILFFFSPLNSFAVQQEPISITLPKSTLAASIKAVLPLQIDTRKIPIKGQFTVVNISNLQITEGGFSCKMKLSGQDMAITTNIGGHKLNLDVGTLQLDVTTDATLRFNAAKQIIYIRPTIKDTKSNGSGKAAQIGPTLVTLLNGQEFPIALQPLQPAVIQTASKQVVINTRILNVKAQKDQLVLHLLPVISSVKIAR